MNTATNEHAIVSILNQRIQEDDIDVPMLPEVANRVVQLTRDPDSEASDLAKLIQSDQALAGHVMRIANSALYSPNSTLVSLQQAITRLGMQIIADIALAASLNSKMFNAPGFEKFILDNLRYSFLTGLWSKEIARACRKNVETAFLAGLLHDIGRLVGIQLVLEVARSLRTKIGATDILTLANHFQRTLGVKVVTQWEMPTLVCDVVTWFDEPEHAGPSREQTFAVVAGTIFASHFAPANKYRTKIDLDTLRAHPSLADLNLYPEDIDKLLAKAEIVKAASESIYS